MLAIPGDDSRDSFQFSQIEAIEQRLIGVHHYQRRDSALWSIGRNFHEATCCFLAKFDGETHHNKNPVRFSDLTCPLIVFFNRLILAPQILLDDISHMFGEISQLLIDMS